ncbi:hypothetical protein NST63_27685 [Heyndrickxia sp. FSL W8-0496]|uniref:hypothetical protein n=1 Tax=Heyndrickxia sp. FSL W8-0496 TaxID=2954702 RepID=UPI0030F8226B
MILISATLRTWNVEYQDRGYVKFDVPFCILVGGFMNRKQTIKLDMEGFRVDVR